jgi:homocysteine S-methyltransferase
VAGIKVDPQIVAMYEGKDRAQGEDLAVRISAEVARQIAPYVDGFYIMTPFQRTGLVARIIAEIRKQEG